jgi:hypothetical protein
MRYRMLMIATLSLAACEMQETARLAQPTEQQLVARPGDTVLSIVKEKTLPFEWGGADLLGRKTNTGLTTLQYRGVEYDRAVFKRRTVLMESDATSFKPNKVPKVHNEPDEELTVSLANAQKKIVVEKKTLTIYRADNNGLVYSISE